MEKDYSFPLISMLGMYSNSSAPFSEPPTLTAKSIKGSTESLDWLLLMSLYPYRDSLPCECPQLLVHSIRWCRLWGNHSAPFLWRSDGPSVYFRVESQWLSPVYYDPIDILQAYFQLGLIVCTLKLDNRISTQRFPCQLLWNSLRLAW